tara:strand:- start:440 stop:586 length:147 start_codon:yes stop_codon:yes gene_type:complete
MNLQKNINIFKNEKLYHNKKFQIFSFFFAIYSNCRPTYGDLDDKENIN